MSYSLQKVPEIISNLKTMSTNNRRNRCSFDNQIIATVTVTTQSLRVKWSDTTSPQFTVMNGVKQGEVLSPILFAIYTDGLLKHLENTEVGCHMGCRFTGALAYADDITLLAPCKSALSIMKSNHVIANYSMLDSFSRCKLHASFCMSLYGSELWNHNSRYVEEIVVAWRKTMRKLFRLPYRTHNYIVCGITEDISIKLHRRLTKFLYSMIHSDNGTVKVMTAFFLSTEASFLAENFRFIMYTYKIPMFAWYKELSVLLKCITCPSSPSDIELSNIDTVC